MSNNGHNENITWDGKAVIVHHGGMDSIKYGILIQGENEDEERIIMILYPQEGPVDKEYATTLASSLNAWAGK